MSPLIIFLSVFVICVVPQDLIFRGERDKVEEMEVYDEVFEFWVPGVSLTGENETKHKIKE